MQKLAQQFVFLDESGKPEIFSARGVNLVASGQATKYLVIVAVRVTDQLKIQQLVTEFRLSLLRDQSLITLFSPSYSLNAFHASPDYPEVKKRFYAFINELDAHVDAIVVDKLKCYTALQQDPGRLYAVMAGQLLKNITHQADVTDIIFSRRDSKLMVRKQLETEVERARLDYLEKHPNLEPTVLLNYQHNPHYTHGGLQIADYIAHAVFRRFEHNDSVWFDLIATKIGKVHDICNKRFYTKKNPL